MAVAYANIGRVRITGSAKRGEKSYIRSVRVQMDEIIRNLNTVIKNVERATPGAIEEALMPIFELSQEYVPYDTGKLFRSGFLRQEKTRSGNVRVAIGYAKHGVPYYAGWVHEMMHIPHQKGKSAKFLERAVNERIHIFKYRLQEEMSKRSGMSASKAGGRG